MLRSLTSASRKYGVLMISQYHVHCESMLRRVYPDMTLWTALQYGYTGTDRDQDFEAYRCAMKKYIKESIDYIRWDASMISSEPMRWCALRDQDIQRGLHGARHSFVNVFAAFIIWNDVAFGWCLTSGGWTLICWMPRVVCDVPAGHSHHRNLSWWISIKLSVFIRSFALISLSLIHLYKW